MTYDLARYTPAHREQVIALLARSFPGKNKTPQAFDWKHQDGPWGASTGWLAVRGEDVVGVRLLLPWQVRYAGSTVSIRRAVDGAVDPSARRQGIFEALVTRVVKDALESPDVAAIYSTSVPASREAYRKVGWLIPDPLPQHVAVPAVWSRAPFDHVAPAEVASRDSADLPPTSLTGTISTDWHPGALAWRADPRSGHTYRAARRRDDAATRLLYRLVPAQRPRPSRLVVVHATGPADRRDALVGAVARHHRVPTVLVPAAPESPRRCISTRPGTQVSLWLHPTHHLASSTAADWTFDGADVEGVL